MHVVVSAIFRPQRPDPKKTDSPALPRPVYLSEWTKMPIFADDHVLFVKKRWLKCQSIV